MTTPIDDLVVIDRGGIVETTHRIHAAVVDDKGRLMFALGDPARLTLVRSAAKPVQALAVMQTGAFAACGFDAADLALMCASHSSEDRHIARTKSMLAKVGAREANLKCGGHPALSEAVTRTWIKADFTPTAVCSNCSGKHVGMLAGARAIGADLATYHLPEHPMQQRVRRAMADVCDLGPDQIEWAIDGCNLPTPAFPLDRLARLYAKLAAAADTTADSITSSPCTEMLARIYDAMVRYPEMVAGEGRYCTTLMSAFKGALIGKVGADGSYAIGVRASEDTRRLGAQGAIGISVKVEDGSTELSYAAASEILAQLKIGSAVTEQALARFHHPLRVNTMGVQTGQASLIFRMRDARA